MRVLFQTRKSLFDAPGGDTIQLKKTREFLEKRGVKVDISLEFSPNLDKYDIVHLFNLMDPQDIYLQYRNALDQNKKTALSTIYGLYTEYERKSRGGVYQIIANLLSPYQVHSIKSIIRYLRRNDLHQGVRRLVFKGSYNMMQEIASTVDILLPNSEGEYNRVKNDLSLDDRPYVVVPNAIDPEIFSRSYEEKSKSGILSVARIEGRKSQLNLVKAINETDLQLTLIGNISPNHKKYGKKVFEEAHDNVRHIQHINQEELVGFYQKSKVHALISWMETPGLSSLEAAVMGCNIVVTKKGDTEEYFGDNAFYCEPDNVPSIVDAITRAYDAEVDTELRDKILNNYTWEQTAKRTIEAYNRIL